MQYTLILMGVKMVIFGRKIVIYFLIFGKNIDRGYTLEPPHSLRQIIFCTFFRARLYFSCKTNGQDFFWKITQPPPPPRVSNGRPLRSINIAKGIMPISPSMLLPTSLGLRGRTGLVVRASDSGSGDPGSILGRVGVLFP